VKISKKTRTLKGHSISPSAGPSLFETLQTKLQGLISVWSDCPSDR